MMNIDEEIIETEAKIRELEGTLIKEEFEKLRASKVIQSNIKKLSREELEKEFLKLKMKEIGKDNTKSLTEAKIRELKKKLVELRKQKIHQDIEAQNNKNGTEFDDKELLEVFDKFFGDLF